MGQALGDLVVSAGNNLIDETLDEITGHSRRKWALVLVAFVAGIAVAGMLRRRAQAKRAAAPPEPAA